MTEQMEGQMSLFDQDMPFTKMFQEPSAPTKEKISEPSSKKPRGSQTKMPLFLDLRKENGLLQEPSWEMGGALLGEYTMHSFGECPREEKESRLSQILEVSPHPKYCLSERACQGILNRANKRGKKLPRLLEEALIRQASPSKLGGGREVDSLGHKAGKGPLIQTELSGTLGVSQDQTLICLEGNGSRPSHQGDGWHEGDPMYTLNSTEHHAIAIENHPADSRVKISEDGMVQTLSSRMGTGGGNVPMVMEPILLESNQNHATIQTDGVSTALPASMGMGGGYVPMVMESINGDISGTLDASYYKGCGERQGVEREVVCVGNGQLAQAKISDKVGALNCMHDQQAIITYGLDRASYNQGQNAKFDFCIDEEKVGAQTAKGPGAVCQSVVRRLTPLECERLQGYPDGWTDIGDWVDSRGKTHNGDADSPRYKALGNSIALPFWQWMAGRMVSNLGERPTMASLFDGIGGFPLVFSRCGCEPIWASEIEEFPIAVTKRRFPEQKED